MRVSRACLCQTGERLRRFRLLLWCGGTLQPGLTPPHLLRCEPSKPALIRGRGGSLADEGKKKSFGRAHVREQLECLK